MNTQRRMTKSLLNMLAGSIGLLLLAGCQSAPTPPTPVPLGTVTIFGKVVDRRTQLGVGGATVSLKINGAWSQTTTSTSTGALLSGSAVDTALGTWAMGGLPGTLANVPMAVQGPTGGATAYVTSYASLASVSGSGTNGSFNAGTTTLVPGGVVTIYLVDTNTGKALVNADNSPIPIAYNQLGGSGMLAGMDFALAAQDATDKTKYTFTIPLNGSSTFSVPGVDINADGVIDYVGVNSTVTFNQLTLAAGQPTAFIPMPPFTDATALAVVASNLNLDGGMVTGFLPAAGPLNIFFNQPVTLDTLNNAITLSFCDNLKAATTAVTTSPCSSSYATVSLTAASTGLTVTQSLGNSLLTITPAAAMVENQAYSVKGGLKGNSLRTSAGVPGYGNELLNLNATTVAAFDVTFTDATLSLSNAAPKITADNGNGCTAGAAMAPTTGAPANCATGGTSSTVSLLFPEPVNGRISINSITVGTTTTTVGSTLSLPCTAMGYYPLQNNGGSGTDLSPNKGYAYNGVACKISTAISMLDSLTAAPSSMNVTFDIWDADGNHYNKAKVDLAVQ